MGYLIKWDSNRYLNRIEKVIRKKVPIEILYIVGTYVECINIFNYDTYTDW